jgi:nucleoside-diphosphate-sugar epimerase
VSKVLVTGGSGFLGAILTRRLLADGHAVTNIDLVPSELSHPNLTTVVGDIRDRGLLDRIMADGEHRIVHHCAAILAHGALHEKELWSANVEGARTLAEACAHHGIDQLVYTSSNCLWGESFDRPVTEDDVPAPVELYGQSKWEAEKIFQAYADRFPTISIRCPTIMDEGRLGLLSILFEFMSENRRVWVVGGGANRYQFIYAKDLVEAMLRAGVARRSDIFGIGSDNVPTMRATYEHVIAHANSRSTVAALPKAPTIAAMKLAYALKVSPLGPYHYKMIASDFMFDTSRIKQALGWRPTLGNEDMLLRAYRYYQINKAEIYSRSLVSAHRKPADMGVIRLLKWLS